MNTSCRMLIASWILFGAGVATGAEPPAPVAAAERDSAAPSHCLRQTGSRIQAQPGKCLPLAGRVITRDEIQRSGATDVGAAVRILIPSVR